MKILVSLFFVNWCFIVFAFAQQTVPTKWENIPIESIPNTTSYRYQGDVLMQEISSISGDTNYRLRKYVLLDDHTKNWSGAHSIIDKYSTFTTGGVYHIKGNNKLLFGNTGTIVYPDIPQGKIYQSLYHYYADKYFFYGISFIVFLVFLFLFRFWNSKQKYFSQKP